MNHLDPCQVDDLNDDAFGDRFLDSAQDEGQYFTCQACNGSGAIVQRRDGMKSPVLCVRCNGEGQRWADQQALENAASIGSSDPFCDHDWSSGYDDTDHEAPIRCHLCGADGDA